ncbi:AAA family ATPase [Halapricum salinum]|uniref:Rad50/SbcC-type AAA domain-containing protein n=1 Tax=Halapricum salinum TaxID=1457250 RepID=A0A4D6HCZ7_9EURY|nr:AAA family ATPase [Halapricum salinum]QCC51441.1 hypothetical protein DV733_09385 [Halapricum salinum]
MNLKIRGIRYENIREFENLELDFSPEGDEPHHISLVQMPNGTGKTTTMKLIRTTLLGADLSSDEVRSYRPPEFEAIEGAFEIDLEFEDELFTLRLELDYEMGEFDYRHIKPEEVGGGDTPGHYLPTGLENTITESFVDLFVFNGELTEEFIQHGSDEAENALKIVNFLNRLEDQRDQIREVVKEQQDDENVTTEKGFKNIKTRLENAEKRLEALLRQKRKLESEIEEHGSNIEELETTRKEILAENQEQLDRYNELGEDITELKSELEVRTETLLDEMRYPSQLDPDINDDLEELLENMNIMQLPKSTSEEFFTELAESTQCICNRPIGEEEREAIRENADQYLSEDDIGVLNSLKDHLRSIPDTKDFEEEFDKLEGKRSELAGYQHERGSLDVDDKDLNEKLEDLSNKIQKQQKEMEEKEEVLEALTTNDKALQEQLGLDWKDNIPLCKHTRNKYEKQIRQASGTVHFGKKADLLEEIFDEFIDRCLESLKNKQIEETNHKLERILGYSRVQVEDIDNSIIVEGRDGTSEGQSLSIAYAYLSTLFEDSKLDVPFVIDSPAVSIDYDKREEVAHIISNLFDQLVIFVISPERERFVSELDSDDIQYLTVHKTDTPGEVVKHTSEDTFMEFQSEEEEEIEA